MNCTLNASIFSSCRVGENCFKMRKFQNFYFFIIFYYFKICIDHICFLFFFISSILFLIWKKQNIVTLTDFYVHVWKVILLSHSIPLILCLLAVLSFSLLFSLFSPPPPHCLPSVWMSASLPPLCLPIIQMCCWKILLNLLTVSEISICSQWINFNCWLNISNTCFF